MLPIALVLAAYFLGSIPFGLLLTKFAGLGDIRGIGSGNIGTTNVLRTGRKSLALATLILDGGKGALAVYLARHYLPNLDHLAGLAAFLGHLYPVWLRFKGGKGVATAFGIMLAVAWPVGLASLFSWLLTALIFRYSSLAALVAVGAAPLYCLLFLRPDAFPLLFTLALFVFLKHAANIKRLRSGTESKIGKGS